MSIGHFYILYPYFLLLLIAIPGIIAWYVFYHRRSSASISVSGTPGFKGLRKTVRQRLRHLPFALRMLALIFLIFGMTQPESRIERTDYHVEGIDIMLALDMSGSMLAEDIKPNRMKAAKEVSVDFIDSRPNDRIGLIVYAAESFLQCPLTIDHPRLKELLSKVRSGMVNDGTAIGDGLGLSVFHLMKSTAVSKVVILLTDGINNTGSLDPLTAAEIAKMFGIRVYTIGAGSRGTAPYPFQTPFGIQYQNVPVEIDEALLQQIAEVTGGLYFRATDKQNLQEIYKKIDELERSRVDVTKFSKGKSEALPLLLIAGLLLLAEFLIRYLALRRIP